MIHIILTVLGWFFILASLVTISDVYSNKTNEARKLVAAVASISLAILAFVIFSQR